MSYQTLLNHSRKIQQALYNMTYNESPGIHTCSYCSKCGVNFARGYMDCSPCLLKGINNLMHLITKEINNRYLPQKTKKNKNANPQ